MGNKTLYVKDSDLPLFEQAQAELGESLSAMFADCIRKRLEEREAQKPEPGKVQKIRLELMDRHGDNRVVKTFKGEWLIGGIGREGINPIDDDDGLSRDAKSELHLARTEKGKLVVYEVGGNDDSASMEVWESFEDLRDAEIDNRYQWYPSNFIAAVAEVLGVDYEVELDI